LSRWRFEKSRKSKIHGATRITSHFECRHAVGDLTPQRTVYTLYIMYLFYNTLHIILHIILSYYAHYIGRIFDISFCDLQRSAVFTQYAAIINIKINDFLLFWNI